MDFTEKINRRDFLRSGTALLGTGCALGSFNRLWAQDKPLHPLWPDGRAPRIDSQRRRFHLTIRPQDVLADSIPLERCVRYPETEPPYDVTTPPKEYYDGELPQGVERIPCDDFVSLWKAAGVSDVWLCLFGMGEWIYDWDVCDRAIEKLRRADLAVHFLTCPLGHPRREPYPSMVRQGFKPLMRVNGDLNGAPLWGSSCHRPADVLCVESVRTLADRYGGYNLFFDDDFRFADSPNFMGGCLCPECLDDFSRKSGISGAKLNELIEDLRFTRPTDAARIWVDYFCDRMTKVFRDSQAAVPESELGIMVMWLGSERSGLRLEDYKGALWRVGEGHFGDSSYDSPEGKLSELFSALFHTRFAPAGRTFSETTMVAPLSVENFSSKLAVATFCDIRNTMFMDGTPVGPNYWSSHAARMKQEAAFHQKLLGCKPKGPFKHYWGIDDRYFDIPRDGGEYSLFLGVGVPFEVCDCEEIPSDGWTFLSNYSGLAVDQGRLAPAGRCLCRMKSQSGRFTQLDETFEAFFAFRRSILPELREKNIPYIEEETPIVLGWYPAAPAALLWNIENLEKTVHLRRGDFTAAVTLRPLDSALVENPLLG